MKALAAAADEGAAPRPSGGDKAARALLDYLEAFVSDEFLPDVYVDFRRAPDLYSAGLPHPVYITSGWLANSTACP